MCWFQTISTYHKNQFILSEGRNEIAFGFNLILRDDNLILLYGGDCYMNTMKSRFITKIIDKAWYHITITVDSICDIEVYVNALFIDLTPYEVPNYSQSNDRFAIGKMSYDYENECFPFDGKNM